MSLDPLLPLGAAATAAAMVALPACAQPPEPGVPTGATTLERALVRELPEIAPIESVVRLAPAPEDGGDVWVGGRSGCARLTAAGEQRALVRFAFQIVNPRPIDIDGDGRWETMGCGGGWGAVGLLDSGGQSKWGYPQGSGSPAPDAMAAGPVGPYGSMAFVIGMNGGDGVHFLDVDGTRFRHVEGSNVFSVAIADLDGDGDAEILHSDGGGFGGKVWVRDRDGQPLRRLDLEFESFSLIRWPSADSPPRLLGIDDGATVQIVDPCGEEPGQLLAEYELPEGGFSEPEGALVRLVPGAPPFLAVTRTIRATWHRSALYVFDSERRLIYHEIFGEPHLGIATVPSSAAGAEDLLVGVGSQLWRYSWPSPQPAAK